MIKARAPLSWLLAVALSALLPASLARAAAGAAPDGLTTVSTSVAAIGLRWTAAPGVPMYQVQYSTSSSMTSAQSTTVSSPAAELTGLPAGKTYYARVRGVSTTGSSLTNYSAAIKATTRTGGYTHLSPTAFGASNPTKTALSLSWASRGDGVRYRVSWATNSTFSGAAYKRVTGTSVTLDALTPGTKYYLRVRVIAESGTNLSAYSAAIGASTLSGQLPAPTGLALTALSKSAAALAWTPTDGVDRYRVQVSRSSSMSGSRYVAASASEVEVSGLTSGITYYFKVRALTAAGSPLSPYSASVSAKMPTSTAASYLPPRSLDATAPKPARLAVNWTSRGSGVRYQLQYATGSDLNGAPSTIVTTTGTTLSGLQPATDYTLRVRVVSSSGDALSAYSAPSNGRTSDAVPAVLRVGSYNVRCANCAGTAPLEHTWYERRFPLIEAVLAQNLDVIGFQEASQGWLKDPNGNSVDKSQFDDLVKRLGAPYKLTNANRNNCVKSSTPVGCVYKDQGASQGTKIIYNSDTLEMLSQGSKRLSEIDPADNDRYVAWAIFEHRKSGQRFLFADTHLENTGNSEGSTAYSDLRIQQTQDLLAVVKEKGKGLPMYVVGDFNSHKWTLPSNGPYDVMRAAGFVDPLGNSYRSTNSTSGATVKSRIRTNFSSYNGFKAKAPSFSYINGTYLDYIWTTPGIEVPEWETVVDVDADNYFVGIIPSDHNLIRATTVLP